MSFAVSFMSSCVCREYRVVFCACASKRQCVFTVAALVHCRWCCESACNSTTRPVVVSRTSPAARRTTTCSRPGPRRGKPTAGCLPVCVKRCRCVFVLPPRACTGCQLAREARHRVGGCRELQVVAAGVCEGLLPLFVLWCVIVGREGGVRVWRLPLSVWPQQWR